MTIRLTAVLDAWGSATFAAALKQAITALPPGSLPLDQGTSQGGYVDDGGLVVTVLDARGDREAVRARVGVFFTEIVASCGCGDEPMATNAYCELDVRIDCRTAEAVFAIST